MTDLNKSLLSRFGGIGDIVMLSPCFQYLHERDGNPCDLITGAGWVIPTLEHCPHVDEFFFLKKRGIHPLFNRSQWQLRRDLKSKSHREFYNLHQESKTARHLAFLNGTQIPVDDYSRTHDTKRRFIELGAPHPPEASDCEPQIYSSDRDINALLSKQPLYSQACILVQPGNKKSMKRGLISRSSNTKFYSNENWQAILKELSQQYPKTSIILIGAPSEYEYLESIAAPLNLPNVYNHANDLNIAELKALCCLAAGIISVDTGPAHLAAALGCPMIELFGPCTPTTHAPLNLGQRISHLVEFADSGCEERLEADISLINPQRVIEQFQPIFDFDRTQPTARIKTIS